jgi:hypothetical protein
VFVGGWLLLRAAGDAPRDGTGTEAAGAVSTAPRLVAEADPAAPVPPGEQAPPAPSPSEAPPEASGAALPPPFALARDPHGQLVATAPGGQEIVVATSGVGAHGGLTDRQGLLRVAWYDPSERTLRYARVEPGSSSESEWTRITTLRPSQPADRVHLEESGGRIHVIAEGPGWTARVPVE